MTKELKHCLKWKITRERRKAKDKGVQAVTDSGRNIYAKVQTKA